MARIVGTKHASRVGWATRREIGRARKETTTMFGSGKTRSGEGLISSLVWSSPSKEGQQAKEGWKVSKGGARDALV